MVCYKPRFPVGQVLLFPALRASGIASDHPMMRDIALLTREIFFVNAPVFSAHTVRQSQHTLLYALGCSIGNVVKLKVQDNSFYEEHQQLYQQSIPAGSR